ncbi:MAG: NAD-dependent DNA ligase LigA [Opitutales bacterium]
MSDIAQSKTPFIAQLFHSKQDKEGASLCFLNFLSVAAISALLSKLTLSLVPYTMNHPMTEKKADQRQLNYLDINPEIQRLIQEIQHHDDLYYKKAAPEISDREYDRLKKKLEQLESVISQSDSPTQRVGDDRDEAFTSYPHRLPMLSLDNTYSQEELKAFHNRLAKHFESEKLEFIIEPKIDGAAVSLTYEHGKLTRALTRGNGEEGDDITENIQTIQELPRTFQGSNIPKLIEVRGEVYLTHKDFERINAEQERHGLPLYANPRNLAAGTLKRLDPQEVQERKLSIVLYGLGFCEPKNAFSSQATFHEAARAWGLPTLEHFALAHGFQEVWQAIEAMDARRHQFSYETDGAVIKLNQITQQKDLGSTAKAPRWAIAFKFETEKAETRIHAITLQVGRTGVITPVAELDPVQLSGTTVSRATLHNEDQIKLKDIRIGDTVIIEKAGEIIPAVLEVVLQKRPKGTSPYEFPKTCPSCHGPIERIEGEAAFRCSNANCPPQMRRRILHFASRQAMDIENLGVAVVDQLSERAIIHNIADLYSLTVEDLLPLEKFAQKSAENLIAAIEKSKSQALWRLIHGLGIPNVGAQTAKDLARHLHSLQALIDANKEALNAIDGIGPTIIQSISSFFANHENQKIIERLLKAGLKTEENPQPGNTQQVLQGKTFVITGTLPNLSREEAKEKIEAAGGKVSSSISKKTDYLLCGASPGSKHTKAETLGTPILDETAFIKLLKEPEPAYMP